MTGAQMVTLWLNDFDVLASQASPGFQTNEILSLLNEAYEAIIMDLYNKKDWVALQALIQDVSYPNTSITVVFAADGTNLQYTCPLPGTINGDVNPMFWLYIDSHSQVFRSAISNTGFITDHATNWMGYLIQNKLVPITEFHKYAYSVYNSVTFIKEPYCCINNNLINVIVDTYSKVVGLDFIYIKQYKPIANTSMIPDLQLSYQIKIVELAVEMGIKVTKSKEPIKQ